MTTNATYNEGDLLEVTKGELVHRERAAKYTGFSGNEDRLYLPELKGGPFLDHMKDKGFTVKVIERAEPPLPPVVLPTEMGYYESADFLISKGCVAYRLDFNGSWWMDGQEMNSTYMANRMPLTRLAPVAEVLAKVGQVFDASFIPLPEALASVAAEYGVTL